MFKLYLLSLLLLLFHFIGFSQSINNVDFSINNKKMFVTFKLEGVSQNSTLSYDFCMKIIKRGNPDIITAKSISGDVINITTNGEKLIVWDIFRDIDFLEGEFKVEVYICNKNPILTSPIDIINKKTISRNQMSGLYLPLSIIAVGGGAFAFSEIQYSKYMKSTLQSDMDKYYTSANLMNKVGLVSAGIGIIWTTIELVTSKKKSKNPYARLKVNPFALSYSLN